MWILSTFVISFYSLSYNAYVPQLANCHVKFRRLNRNIANAIFDGIDVESKVWEDSIVVLALIRSAWIVNPCDDLIVLMTRNVTFLFQLTFLL